MGVTDEIVPADLPTAILGEKGEGIACARYHDALNQAKEISCCVRCVSRKAAFQQRPAYWVFILNTCIAWFVLSI